MFQALINRLKQFSFFNAFLHSSTYFIAQIAIQGLGIISLPIYTYYLTIGDYGFISTYLSYVTVLGVVMTFNFNGAVARYFYEEKSDFKSFLGTTLVSTFIPFLLFALIIFLFRVPIAEKINLPVSVIPWLLVFTATAIIWRIYEQLKVAQQKSKEYAFSQIILQYAKFGLAVVGILLMQDAAYLGKIQGEAIAAVLMSLYFIYKLIPWVKPGFSKEHLGYIANYSFPLIPVMLSGYILNAFDLWFINPTLGEESAGLYSFAYKIGILLMGLITALLNGTSPEYYKLMNDKNHHQASSQIVSVFKLLFLGALFLIFFGGDVGYILASNKSFTASLDIVPIIVMGYVFFGVAQFLNRYILFVKRNTWLTFMMIIVALINVFLNYWYIPIYGYKVAAITTMASYGIMMILSYGIVVFWMKAPGIPSAKIFQLGLILGIFVSCAYYLHFNVDHYLTNFGLRLLLFALFGLILFQDKLRKIIAKT